MSPYYLLLFCLALFQQSPLSGMSWLPFLFLKKLLATLRCMWDLSSPTKHWTSTPLHWNCRVLTTGPPWKCIGPHFCWLKSYPFFKALFKFLVFREGFPDHLQRNKCCFSVASLDLYYSIDHILISMILVSMSLSPRFTFEDGVGFFITLTPHRTEFIADIQ